MEVNDHTQKEHSSIIIRKNAPTETSASIDSKVPDSKYSVNDEGELIMEIPVRKEDYESLKSKSKETTPVKHTEEIEGEEGEGHSSSDEGEHLSYTKGSPAASASPSPSRGESTEPTTIIIRKNPEKSTIKEVVVDEDVPLKSE